MLLETIKRGSVSGLKCCWFLLKIVIPVYFLITVLKHTPAMDFLATLFKPAMGLFNMPGEAAVPMITGFVLDEYGVIAAIKAVGLTGFSVTVVTLMTLIAHSLFVEAAILKKMDMSITFFTCYRLIAAVAVGFIFNGIGVALQLW